MTDNIFAHEHPESDRARGGGFTLWFTGLSGSGKSTIAHLVGPALDERGHVVEYLDGDTIRTHLSKGLGFSKEDRDTNIERIGWVASRLTRQGGAVIAAAISPYRETRAKARELVEQVGRFVEVYVDTPLEVCEARDVKGLYAKARAGEIPEFTGISSPYEAPTQPSLVLHAGAEPRLGLHLVDDADCPARTHVGDDLADGVRPDVDGGDANAVREAVALWAGPRGGRLAGSGDVGQS